jgi:NADH-quinone oxidoreductase subunit N
MRPIEIIALLPIIVALTHPVVLMLAIAIRRHHGLTLTLSLIGYAATLGALIPAAHVAPTKVTPLLTIDGLALYLTALVAIGGAASALFAYGERARGREEREEIYVLLSIAVLGAAVLASSRHFAALFLGLELISVPLFPLIAYSRLRRRAVEAGMKYLVVSGVATSLLLFGIALLYAGVGTLELAGLGRWLAGEGTIASAWAMGGIALIMAGLAMKLSLFPLHWWTPDVYQGAPSPVTGFLATVAKGGVIVVLLRLLLLSNVHQEIPVTVVLVILAVLSMVAGNLLALRQENVKRILAYSSIAHMGYFLVAFLAAGPLAVEAVSFYLAAYFLASLGAFGVVALHAPEGEDIASLRGFYGDHPWLAVTFALMLLSLAGIPLTAGFIGKFYLFAAGVDSARWIAVGALVVSSVIGLFYYLRIISALFIRGDQGEPTVTAVTAGPVLGWVALAVITALLIGLGLYPTPLIGTIHGLWAQTGP